MQNYHQFVGKFKEYIALREMGKQEGNEEAYVSDTGNTGEHFVKNMASGLGECKIFIIKDKVKNLLSLTRTPKNNKGIKLPFDSIFLDVSFEKKEMLESFGVDIGHDKIVGMLVRYGQMSFDIDGEKKHNLSQMREGKINIGTNIRISIVSQRTDEEGKPYDWFDTFNHDIQLSPEFKSFNGKIQRIKESDPKTSRFCWQFLLNFLNFLYDNEVEIIEVSPTKQQNEKRIKKGKQTLPSTIHINLIGRLYRYVNGLTKEHFEYSYAFWVRGHYRHFRSDKFVNKKGDVTFIYPFIKGIDKSLVEKPYEVDE